MSKEKRGGGRELNNLTQITDRVKSHAIEDATRLATQSRRGRPKGCAPAEERG